MFDEAKAFSPACGAWRRRPTDTRGHGSGRAALREAAFKLRRDLTRKASATKSAVRAEQEAFRLGRKLQQIVIEDTDLSLWRVPLPTVYPSGYAVDFDRQPRGEDSAE